MKADIMPTRLWASAGAFEQLAALASTAVVRRPRGALVTADPHQGTTASCEENKLHTHESSLFSSIRFHQFAQIRFSAAG
jgi:hypothetical protein